MNKATIIKADKGNSIAITYLDEYDHKIQSFIDDNEFSSMANDPRSKYQRQVRQSISSCPLIIPANTKQRFVVMNPTSPQIRGLIKVHKPDSPIRPVINWTNAPAYKIAKQLVKILNTHIPLPFVYNITNTIHLLTDLREIPCSNNLCFASFDISNMYTNIPTNQIPDIIRILCNQQNIESKLQSEIMRLCQVVLTQNYFSFRSSTYLQTTGLAMGAPTSPLFSEIFLQYLEDTHFFTILTQHKIIGYFRYVDDILIVYDSTTTDIHNVLAQFNNSAPSLTFTMEKEKDNCINFLDVSIIKHNNSLHFKIYRKPTATDTIIPADSNHPIDHKYSAIRYLLHRLQSYPISDIYKHMECDTICHILRANQYSTTVIQNIRSRFVSVPSSHRTHDLTLHNVLQQDRNRFATFTYFGKETRYVTKIFKHTNVKIAFKTRNTIERLLRHRQPVHHEDSFGKSGIYKLTCQDCKMIYVGQTGRSFRTRFREHARDFKYRTGNSKFAQHLIDQSHSFGSIDSIMGILHVVRKGAMMDTMERFQIYKATSMGIQINDRSTVGSNVLFDTVLSHVMPGRHP